MSVAEKLIRIAENEQKVYDKGYQQGGKNGYQDGYEEGFLQGKQNGYEEGHMAGGVEGYNQGKQEGYQEGKEAGKTAEWNEFWDNHQRKGNTTTYTGAFSGWKTANFKPKYDIIPITCNRIFTNFGYWDQPFDLQQLVEKAGIKLDFSKSQNMGYAFNMCNAKRLGVIDLSSASTAEFMCAYAAKLETIDEIILSEEKFCKLNGAFNGATALKNIKITGKIMGQSGIIFEDSLFLTHDSLISIFNALDGSHLAEGRNYTLSLGSRNFSKLTNEEKAIATQKGWTLA